MISDFLVSFQACVRSVVTCTISNDFLFSSESWTESENVGHVTEHRLIYSEADNDARLMIWCLLLLSSNPTQSSQTPVSIASSLKFYAEQITFEMEIYIFPPPSLPTSILPYKTGNAPFRTYRIRLRELMKGDHKIQKNARIIKET